jgi:hypothetical protein
MIPLPSWTQLTAFLRQAAAIVALVISLGDLDHLPTSVRTVLVAISGTLLTVEHYTAAQTTAPVTVTTTAPLAPAPAKEVVV